MRKIFLLLLSFFIFVSCQSTIFSPVRSIVYNPQYVKKQVEDYAIETLDNTTLHAWRIQTKQHDKKGAILFFHGNGGNIGSEFFQVEWLLDYGYDIFMADYRGYGFSQGKSTIDNFLSDSLDIMDAFIELYAEEENIILLGQSLGGQAATNVASNSQHADKIKLLILDSTFTSWRSVAKEIASSFFITWPFQSLNALNFPKESSAIEFITQSKVKNILILHSRDDKLISDENADKLFNEAISAGKATHIKLEKFDKIPHAGILFNLKSRKQLLDAINSFYNGKTN